ncbi:hypothetical protein [Photobacterium rosenbergii]|uniref:hypothetical protein n=1 Tax=Photobacterium rosenbergii TaxID=294936 RepID=UPI001C9977BC|nr:hypothetical protein [Photobacterium rosenbergii]MBY5947416.1 hypothetical protein [Photobacterium rosenbergii]
MKKAIAIGVVQLPLQIVLALMVQAALINAASIELVKWWYLLISLSPVFVILEFAYPQIAISYFNTSNGNKPIKPFVKKSLLIITCFQFIFFLVYSLAWNINSIESLVFFLAMYLRSIGNILISIVYAKGKITQEKLYKLIFTSLFPFLFLISLTLFDVSKFLILFIWLLSSFIIFAFAFINYSKVNDDVKSQESEFNLSVKSNLRLILTTLPGVFIFNLSIYYLEFFYKGEQSVEVVTFGLFLQLFNVFNILNSIFPSVCIPSISRKFHNNRNISSDVRKILFINRTVSIFIIIGSVFFGELILSSVLSSNDINFKYIIYFFISAIVIESLQVTLTSISIGTGYYKYHVPSFFSATFVLLVSYFLVPDYGSYGLMISILFAQIVTCFPVNSYLSSKRLGISLRGIITNWLYIVISLVLSMYVISYNLDVINLLIVYLSIFVCYMAVFKSDIINSLRYISNGD